MRKNLIRKIGIVLVVCVVGGVMASCKAGHDVCPAYTKIDLKEVNQY